MEHRSPDTKAYAALAFLPDAEWVPELLLFIVPGLLRSNASPSHDRSHEAGLRPHGLPGPGQPALAGSPKAGVVVRSVDS